MHRGVWVRFQQRQLLVRVLAAADSSSADTGGQCSASSHLKCALPVCTGTPHYQTVFEDILSATIRH